jgi:hypothetical protein
MASCLPVKEIMNHTCQHCGELIVGNAWLRVLDMVVCSLCFMEAKRLHLHAEEINIGSKTSFTSKPGKPPSSTRHLIEAPVSMLLG